LDGRVRPTTYATTYSDSISQVKDQLIARGSCRSASARTPDASPLDSRACPIPSRGRSSTSRTDPLQAGELWLPSLAKFLDEILGESARFLGQEVSDCRACGVNFLHVRIPYASGRCIKRLS